MMLFTPRGGKGDVSFVCVDVFVQQRQVANSVNWRHSVNSDHRFRTGCAELRTARLRLRVRVRDLLRLIAEPIQTSSYRASSTNARDERRGGGASDIESATFWAAMAGNPRPVPRPPIHIRLGAPLMKRLMRLGVPMGPSMAILTVRGRRSGLPRTTPVTLVAVDERRWVIGTFGDSNWVRNLRAASEATLKAGRRSEPVRAAELSQDEKATFFREVMKPFVRGVPMGSLMLGMLSAGDILEDPDGAAVRHPVFELHQP